MLGAKSAQFIISMISVARDHGIKGENMSKWIKFV